MRISDSQLSKFLLDSGLVSRREIVEAAAEAKKREVALKSVLLARGTVPETDLRRLEAHILGIPFIDLRGAVFDLGIMSIIPEPLSRSLNAVAYKKDGYALEIAVLDPVVARELAEIERKHRVKILLRVTDTESMKHALVSYQRALKDKFGNVIEESLKRLKGDIIDEVVLVTLVDTILSHALVEHATDIHLELDGGRAIIRYRIGGRLQDAMIMPPDVLPLLIKRLKFLSGIKNVSESGIYNGRFELDLNGERINVRTSFIKSIKGEKAVLRLVKEGASGFTLEALGFSEESLESIHDALREKNGLILVTGEKGSGKSTTLYTLLDILNTPETSIATIEEEVEYSLDRVNQVEVNVSKGLTYAEGLRGLIKQDADIVMVGEIKDAETASLSTHAAYSRKLILSSLIAKSAKETLEKMSEFGVESSELAASLKLIISQLLVGKLGSVRSSYYLTKDEQSSLGKLVSLDRLLKKMKDEGVVKADDSWDEVPFWKGDFSPDEMVLLDEVIVVGPRLRELIQKGGTTRELNESIKSSVSRTLLEDGIIKAVQGQTSLEEVLKKCIVEREI